MISSIVQRRACSLYECVVCVSVMKFVNRLGKVNVLARICSKRSREKRRRIKTNQANKQTKKEKNSLIIRNCWDEKKLNQGQRYDIHISFFSILLLFLLLLFYRFHVYLTGLHILFVEIFVLNSHQEVWCRCACVRVRACVCSSFTSSFSLSLALLFALYFPPSLHVLVWNSIEYMHEFRSLLWFLFFSTQLHLHNMFFPLVWMQVVFVL